MDLEACLHDDLQVIHDDFQPFYNSVDLVLFVYTHW